MALTKSEALDLVPLAQELVDTLQAALEPNENGVVRISDAEKKALIKLSIKLMAQLIADVLD